MKYLIMLTFLFSSQIFATPCGQEGSVDDRIKNCNFAKGDFVLVARDDKGLEIYQDTKTSLIWGDRITVDYNHFGSQKACSEDLAEAQLLKTVHWRLPNVHEFEVASTHGMKTALPHMDHGFWTSTPVKMKRRRRANPAQAFLWDGLLEKTETGDLKDGASVRCIGKEEKKS